MARPRDTSPDAYERQRAALRAMTPWERLAVAADLSDAGRRLTEAGVRARHPEFTTQQVDAEVRSIVQRAAGRSRATSKRSTG